MSANEIPSGAQTTSSTQGEFNNVAFVIQQALSKLQTATLVRVEAVTNAGGLSPVGFVDVTPLVNQIDGQGKATPHATIFNVPYFRLQGGTDAIIIDPKVGDIGMAAFASRDISKIKTTKASGNPGSFRQYSFSDAMYCGGLLNGTPTQYIQFSSAGIKIHSPTAVILEAPIVDINAGVSCTVTAPTFTVNGNTVLNGTVSQTGGGDSTFSGDITAPDGDISASGISLVEHTHGGVMFGTDTSGPPI